MRRVFTDDAPENDKEKLQALFGSWLKHYAEADIESLKTNNGRT